MNEHNPDDILHYQDSLRFPPDLEHTFQSDYNQRIMRIARPGTALAILVYLSFWILDLFVLPQAFEAIWLVRLMGIALLAILFVISFAKWYKNYVSTFFGLACLVINISVVICFALTHPDELVFNLYYVTLIFTILGAPMLGLPLLWEITVSITTLIVYLATAIFLQKMLLAPALLAGNSFFLIGAVIIGIVGAYFGEINIRRDYLQRLVINLEHARSERLLLNILPVPIAARLKRGETIADYFPSASVLFADIANFTPLSAALSPEEIVGLLNEVFSYFDKLVEKYNLEKIKTIGDCYMVAAGVPVPRDDHAKVIVNMALEMQRYVKEHKFLDRVLSFRIGVHSGPLVAGIIGEKKFIYDLWGDSVNTASRMETHGMIGAIQITRATYDLVKDEFECISMGTIEVKGKGQMEVWKIL